jgi:hypothetical protein
LTARAEVLPTSLEPLKLANNRFGDRDRIRVGDHPRHDAALLGNP